MVETGELGASVIQFSAISRHGDEHELFLGITLSELLGDLIAVNSRQADIEKDHLGLLGSDVLDHREPIIGTEYLCPSSSRIFAIVRAESRLSSTTRIRRWRATRLGRCGCGFLAVGRPLFDERQAHHELAPLPGAGARNRDRAVVQLDQASNERQPDPEPAARAIERMVGLNEEIEDLVLHLGCDADAGVLHASTRPDPLRVPA